MKIVDVVNSLEGLKKHVHANRSHTCRVKRDRYNVRKRQHCTLEVDYQTPMIVQEMTDQITTFGTLLVTSLEGFFQKFLIIPP